MLCGFFIFRNSKKINKINETKNEVNSKWVWKTSLFFCRSNAIAFNRLWIFCETIKLNCKLFIHSRSASIDASHFEFISTQCSDSGNKHNHMVNCKKIKWPKQIKHNNAVPTNRCNSLTANVYKNLYIIIIDNKSYFAANRCGCVSRNTRAVYVLLIHERKKVAVSQALEKKKKN